MKNCTFKLRCVRIASVSGLVAAISACGGGGGDPSAGPNNPGLSGAATVSSLSVGSLMYGKTAIFTVTGTHLDQGVTVSATGCQTPVLMTNPPAVNTSTTAHYQCAGLVMGAGTFSVVAAAAPLARTTFDVPEPQVTMTLSNGQGNGVDGTIVMTLSPDKTPLTVDNFLDYVNTGFYDGTVINAVATGYAIQGGGAAVPVAGEPLVPKPNSRNFIPLEVNKGLSNMQWIVAMTYNHLIGTMATSQFFINLKDNSTLFDPNPGFPSGYAVFGKVTAGTNTVNSIVAAPCIANVVLGLDGTLGCTPTPYVVVTKAIQTR